MLTETIYLFEESLSLHFHWVGDCLFDAQHDLHLLVFEVETGDVGAQGHIHALLDEETAFLQLPNLEDGSVEDVAIVQVCLELRLFLISCLSRLLDAGGEDEERVSALAGEEDCLDEVSVLSCNVLASSLHVRRTHFALEDVVAVEVQQVAIALPFEGEHSEE